MYSLLKEIKENCENLQFYQVGDSHADSMIVIGKYVEEVEAPLLMVLVQVSRTKLSTHFYNFRNF